MLTAPPVEVPSYLDRLGGHHRLVAHTNQFRTRAVEHRLYCCSCLLGRRRFLSPLFLFVFLALSCFVVHCACWLDLRLSGTRAPARAVSGCLVVAFVQVCLCYSILHQGAWLLRPAVGLVNQVQVWATAHILFPFRPLRLGHPARIAVGRLRCSLIFAARASVCHCECARWEVFPVIGRWKLRHFLTAPFDRDRLALWWVWFGAPRCATRVTPCGSACVAVLPGGPLKL